MASHTVHSDSTGKYIVVVKGDTLSAIALECKTESGGKTYQQLAALNSIPNANLIYIDQKIYLTKSSSSSSGGSSNSNKATVNHFGVQSTDEGTLFATWTWSQHSNTEKYETWWEYDLGDGIWYISKGTADERQTTWSIPSGAKAVKFWVKPISKTYGENNTTHFTADWSTEKKWTNKTPLDIPSSPKVEIKDYTLTATLDNIDINDATHICFQAVKDNKSQFGKRGEVRIVTGHASYSWTVDAGAEYKVRCYAYYKQKDGCWSDWSAYSENVSTMPSAISGDITIAAESETSVYLAWQSVKTATKYEIQYAEKKEYLDGSGENTTITVEGTTYYRVTGLASGTKYFFRVRAGNAEGYSAWSKEKSIVIGTDPAAPTTWSSTTSAVVGEEVVLYWVHNTEDGSSQVSANLELVLSVEGDSTIEKTSHVVEIKNSTSEELKDKTSYCIIDTKNGYLRWSEDGVEKELNLETTFQEGVHIDWRVQTSGITNEYGDWSTTRTVDIYATPSLSLDIGRPIYYLVERSIDPFYRNYNYNKVDTEVNIVRGSALDGTFTTDNEQVYSGITTDGDEVLYCRGIVSLYNVDDTTNNLPEVNAFPIYISALPGPKTQSPIGYHISITANESHETTNSIGNTEMIKAGEQVYSEYFDVKYDLLVELSAGNIDLANNITYTVTCTVSMDSGLTAEASSQFKVSWVEVGFLPNAEVAIDVDTLTASIRPYCNDTRLVYCKVERNGRLYTATDTTFDYVYGKVVNNAITQTGEQVYYGFNADGEEIYYCEKELVTPVTDIYLSVYRREFDGGFTELATMLDGENNTAITDPHPALDFARYRIVAASKTTGSVSYYDLPAIPVEGSAVIIQWDEAWTSFETTEDTRLAEPTWSGSMLKLPYNIDVSDSTNPEVEMVEYIGRKHPVSYYGTQRGQSATWNVVIEKDDEETIYGLRRLSMWMGDGYVREPSGSGYWANIQVSFSQKHRDLTIPVSLKITRVEGGA